MAEFKTLLPAELFDLISKCGISTPKQILTLSTWDIKKNTNLNTHDIALLKNIAAKFSFSSGVLRGDKILTIAKITSGCAELDNLLEGGFRSGTITEIYGESGSGKTQICMNASLYNWRTGAVYICTEDAFPMARFEQMKHCLPSYNPTTDYGKKIFVDLITEAVDLNSCVKVRLPKLMEAHRPCLIVVDSIAGPFRSDNTNYINRAQDLREIALALIKLAKQYNAAVICVNQVTACCEDIMDDQTIPSLGLAWSNMVSSRLSVKKTDEILQNVFSNISDNHITPIREIDIVFSPDLPNSKFKFIITSAGISHYLN